ncbi:hypothetical protein RHSIM_Rhsim06G0070300 [Rhododendron simsii]|uniref:Uncharacterized protein n=1 Tax=Rhododendron simsii TaxID=118357 RepID=A0A834GU19_RHOSS|nr:hypothetical protein RHSIM_Rhsim06G0070300 [Rhododendron simsii]
MSILDRTDTPKPIPQQNHAGNEGEDVGESNRNGEVEEKAENNYFRQMMRRSRSMASSVGDIRSPASMKGRVSGGKDQEEDEDLAEANEEESDLDLAWKMLDLAWAIVEKHSDNTMEKVDILSTLAEVALEREDIETSLSDYLKAQAILECLVESDSRCIAKLYPFYLQPLVSNATSILLDILKMVSSKARGIKNNAPPSSTSSSQMGAAGLFHNGDVPSSVKISDSNRTNPTLVKVNRKSRNRFVYVPCPHTAKALCQVLMDTFLEWNIDRKLSTLTIDNCTTNDAMIDLLLENLEGAQKREETFEGAARQLRITYGKNLSLDCPTRWNSSFLMLQTAIKYRNAFGRLKLKDPQCKSYPNDDDWNLAEDICERLEIFYKVTLLFSGTTYPTSNLFFPDVCDIKVRLSEWVCCGIDVVEEMTFNMLEKYDKYWDNMHGFLAIVVMLDPRFKMSLIEFQYKRIYGEHGVGMTEDIRRRCYDLLTLYQGKSPSKDRSESSSKALPSTYLRDRTSLSDYLDQQMKTKTVHVKSELDRYLEEEQLPMCDDFGILGRWKSNGLKYPVLQAIARDVLAVPVSTIASESSFSTSGRMVSPSRNRLHPKTLEALMCTQSWLAALENEVKVPTINDGDMDVDD